MESFYFSGNHYGTPKPSKDSGRVDPGGGSVTNSSGSNGPTANVNFPGNVTRLFTIVEILKILIQNFY